MYFWNISKLKDDFRQGQVSDSKTLPYFLFWIFGFSFSSIGEHSSNADNMAFNFLSSLLWVLLQLGGVLYLYHRNGGAAGDCFFKKFFAIGFVWSIRYGCFVLLLFAALTGLSRLLSESALGPPYQWVFLVGHFLFGAAALLYYYYGLGEHLADSR